MTGRALAFALALAILGGAPRPAAAFVQVSSPEGLPLAWPSACVYYAIDSLGSQDLPFDQFSAAIVRSFDSWEMVTTSYIRFMNLGARPGLVEGWTGGGAEEDVIRVVETDWANMADPENPRPSGAIALTTTFFNPATGEILGSDMVLNGEQFTFTASDVLVGTDLSNTVTHEAGHFIGIDHNCYEPGSGLDFGEGPDCDADPLFAEATMFWRADPIETKKRTLESDDILGVSSVYPIDRAVTRCELPGWQTSDAGGCRCSVAGRAPAGPGPGPALLVVVGVAAWRLRARRRRVSPAS